MATESESGAPATNGVAGEKTEASSQSSMKLTFSFSKLSESKKLTSKSKLHEAEKVETAAIEEIAEVEGTTLKGYIIACFCMQLLLTSTLSCRKSGDVLKKSKSEPLIIPMQVRNEWRIPKLSTLKEEAGENGEGSEAAKPQVNVESSVHVSASETTLSAADEAKMMLRSGELSVFFCTTRI